MRHDTAHLMQVYLVSQMRASALVARGLGVLGAARGDIEAARIWAKKEGLETIGHPMATYVRLLGKPQRRRTHPSSEEYQQEEWAYSLPLWPDLLLTVLGRADGVTGGLRFAATDDRRSPGQAISVDQLPGWSFLEHEITQVLPTARVIESWYPQSDYECRLPPQPTADPIHLAARFDFGLFQDLVPMSG